MHLVGETGALCFETTSNRFLKMRGAKDYFFAANKSINNKNIFIILICFAFIDTKK
jgi:hypothetical protein